MKFMHLGDLHLGKSLCDFDLIRDQQYILNRIVDIAKENQVYAVLIAGDVYDKAIPSEAAVRLLDSFLNQLVAEKIKVFMISGNHDSDERLHFGAEMFEKQGVYIASRFEGKLKKIALSDRDLTVNVYMMPFVKASIVRHFYEAADIKDYDSAVRTVIDNSGVNEREINILVAHQFVKGKGAETVLAGSEGMAVRNVGNVEIIGADCFDSFDYVALGHIHSPQKVGRETVRYAGSPLKYSLNEAMSDKSVPIIEVTDKGNVTLSFVGLEPMRELRHIKGRLQQLLAPENVMNTEDFMYVTLTDEAMENDVMSIFQQVYPNTLRVAYENSHTKELGQVTFEHIAKGRSFLDTIADFYQMMYGCEITQEELRVMEEIAKEARVTDETD